MATTEDPLRDPRPTRSGEPVCICSRFEGGDPYFRCPVHGVVKTDGRETPKVRTLLDWLEDRAAFYRGQI